MPVAGVSKTAEVTAVAAANEDEIREKIDKRNAARKRKDFAEADRIRNELLVAGIVLEDSAQGTTWRRS